jgi:hypothetical protein
VSNKYNQPVYPIIEEKATPMCFKLPDTMMQMQEPGINLVTHIAMNIVVDSNAGISTSQAEALMGEPIPESSVSKVEWITWWIRAEARYKIAHATALIDELVKQNLL